jgi:hypothetical protein
MMRKEFMTGMMDCDSAEMICGPPHTHGAKGGQGWARVWGGAAARLPSRKSACRDN